MCKICAFTGHRWGVESPDIELIDRVILNLIKTGTDTFLCGMAIGFDMICARSVINYKKIYDIKLIACVPCFGQESRYSDKNKAEYERILQNCDEIRTLSYEYFKGCMQARDRYLVDNSDVLLCFLRKSSGGTYYTVNYAKKARKKIIEI